MPHNSDNNSNFSDYCSTYPFNPTDTYPQIMSDGRAFTNYMSSKRYNCEIMGNVAKRTGTPFDPRDYRRTIAGKIATIGQTHEDCFVHKYDSMQNEMKKGLTDLERYVWNN